MDPVRMLAGYDGLGWVSVHHEAIVREKGVGHAVGMDIAFLGLQPLVAVEREYLTLQFGEFDLSPFLHDTLNDLNQIPRRLHFRCRGGRL